MSSIRVRMAGTSAWKDLHRRLKAASNGRELRRELKREIELESRFAIADVRASVLAVEVDSSAGGGGSTGLRARIAAAVSAKALASGVRIFVSGVKVDRRYGRTLARLMNNTGGRAWIHPLFGNQEHQHWQRGRDYFATSIRPHAAEFRRGCERAMAKVAAMIRG
ncbi:hypothetical protein DMP17_22200 [Pseudonocardia sp. TMWB2A]|uniref:hypothetical protein n=1 Tax=Pseudonocardia sp. TMWB2A TaxID=687430 RepID=UPI00307D0263